MRMTERVEHLFPCVMTVEPFKQAVADAEALVNDNHSLENLVQAGQLVLDALDDLYPQCSAVALELQAYANEIRTIVVGKPVLSPTPHQTPATPAPSRRASSTTPRPSRRT